MDSDKNYCYKCENFYPSIDGRYYCMSLSAVKVLNPKGTVNPWSEPNSWTTCTNAFKRKKKVKKEK